MGWMTQIKDSETQRTVSGCIPVLVADCVEEDSSHICQKAEPKFFLARDIGPKTQGLQRLVCKWSVQASKVAFLVFLYTFSIAGNFYPVLFVCLKKKHNTELFWKSPVNRKIEKICSHPGNVHLIGLYHSLSSALFNSSIILVSVTSLGTEKALIYSQQHLWR